MPDQRFPPQCRIRRGSDFRRAYQNRCSASDESIIIYGYVNELPYARLGISASRKIGNAVARNRWKRLLREAFRLTRSQLPTGVDLIVVPRATAEPALASLVESFPKLAVRVAKKTQR
jgi:ribonuclease P protein component